jgi:hypothetical protein
VRHLAVEIDATADQQDKLRAIVRAAVKACPCAKCGTRTRRRASC